MGPPSSPALASPWPREGPPRGPAGRPPADRHSRFRGGKLDQDADPRAPRVAIVDGASFVLPYDHGLATGLVARGRRVQFFGSTTRFNGEFLQALRDTPGVTVRAQAVSGTVAPRWRGVPAYAALLWGLLRRRREFDVINLQFSVLWPLELPVFWRCRDRFVFTVHNAVPHGHAAPQHAPTRWLAGLARRLVFASESVRDDFARRYGTRYLAKSTVLQHGLLPLAPGEPVVPYAPLREPQALVFWSSVRPYKGVDLFLELARSRRWREHGLPLEVHGAWSRELHPLRDELRSLGVQVADRFLDAVALRRLFARPVLFALPYREASQSGALYTLLHQGRSFVCSDTGDLGAFMRRFNLQGLLLRERTVDAVLASLTHLRQHAGAVAATLALAQAQLQWPRVLARAEEAYG